MTEPRMSRWWYVLAVVTGGSLQACSPSATSPDAGPSTPTTATGATTGTPAQGPGKGAPDGSLVGTWVSPSCGERTYARELDLAADGTFRAADLVSPCPPKVVCVWSGIVHRKGTYTVAGGKITLTPSDQGGPQGQPFPETLGIDPATGAPFEPDNGGPACTYARKP